MIDESHELEDLNAGLAYKIGEDSPFSKEVDVLLKCSLGRCVPQIFKVYDLRPESLRSKAAV